MRLTPEKRAKLLEELRVRERFTLKRISLRHRVSRQTLTRLLAELRDSGTLHVEHDLSQFDSNKAHRLR